MSGVTYSALLPHVSALREATAGLVWTWVAFFTSNLSCRDLRDKKSPRRGFAAKRRALLLRARHIPKITNLVMVFLCTRSLAFDQGAHVSGQTFFLQCLAITCDGRVLTFFT